jgi:hypothetical protein
MAEATPVAAVVLIPTQELALSLKLGVENYASFSPSDGIVAWASGISFSRAKLQPGTPSFADV